MELVTTGKEQNEGPISLSKWSTSSDIVINTCAVVACFDVTYQGNIKKYVHWADFSSYIYMFEFQSKANELRDKQFNDKPIFYHL